MELNKIYNENCLDTMSRMGDCFVDLVITSPPYDNLRKYEGYLFDFESIAKELYRTMKSGGVIVWVVNDQTIDGSESGTSFKQALFFKEKCGFNLYDTMIYAKENPVPLQHRRYEQQFEFMFILSKGIPKTFNPIRVKCKAFGRTYSGRHGKQYDEQSYAMRNSDSPGTIKRHKIKGNIWYFNRNSEDKTVHNAYFPEELVRDHLISWSNEGDLVYDPFMGSGTTGKVCVLNNRNFIGSEISEKYCEEARKRIESYSKIRKFF